MKVHVDPERCQGHLRCVFAVPEVFDEDDQGHSVVREADVPAGREERVRRAADNCPELAIDVADLRGAL